MRVKSKYSLHTYIGLSFGFLFLILGTIFSITTDLSENAKKVAIPKFYLIAAFFLVVFYILYRIFKTAPTIRVENGRIKISGLVTRRIEIEKKDILQIDLFAVGDLMGWHTIVTKIELNEGEKITITDPNYANKGELKQALVDNFSEKIKPYKIQLDNFKSIPSLNVTEKFAGNPFTSFNGIMLFGITLIPPIIGLQKTDLQLAHIFLIIPVVIAYLGFSYQLHYFVFSGNMLTVKNHFQPWINRRYMITDIIAFNFEHPGRLSQSLRITTKDFKSRYYSAGSLREKHWNALKEKIETSGIHFIP